MKCPRRYAVGAALFSAVVIAMPNRATATRCPDQSDGILSLSSTDDTLRLVGIVEDMPCVGKRVVGNSIYAVVSEGEFARFHDALVVPFYGSQYVNSTRSPSLPDGSGSFSWQRSGILEITYADGYKVSVRTVEVARQIDVNCTADPQMLARLRDSNPRRAKEYQIVTEILAGAHEHERDPHKTKQDLPDNGAQLQTIEDRNSRK